MRICIDPGHGGKDSGAVGFGTEEDDVALAVAFKLKTACERQGWLVTMTRTGETYPTLTERCNIANNFGADLFVSTHFDCSDNAAARGNSVLYLSSEGSSLGAAIYRYLQPLTPWPDRGLSYRPELAVLNGTHMTAVIVEGAFISNSEEHALIINPGWQTMEAEAVCHGMCDYLKVPYVTNAAPAVSPIWTEPDIFYINVDHSSYSESQEREQQAKADGNTYFRVRTPQMSYKRFAELQALIEAWSKQQA